MTLHTLLAQNLRIIEHLELTLADEATLFCGENGAGKTSILEAIDFLSRGRSFRSRRLAPLLRRGSESITVSGQIVESGRTTHLGIQKSADATVLHCNQQKVETISNHASHLPVVCMHPDSHQLVQGGARHRRNYLDWSAFHVKPEFLHEWRKYNKCLRQRNYVLRHGANKTKELEGWTQELGKTGECIDQSRSEIFEELKPIFDEYSDNLLPECKVSLIYVRGWPSKLSLIDALEQVRLQELQKKTTRCGPHRADIKISLNGQDAALAASRGQQKLIAAILMLAQIDHAQQNSTRKCVVLLDDVRAELDHVHAQALFVALQALKSQVLLSAIEPGQVDLQGWTKSKVFHVKHGTCELLA